MPGAPRARGAAGSAWEYSCATAIAVYGNVCPRPLGQAGWAVALMEAECVLCASLWAEEDTEVTTCRGEGGV